MAQQNHDSSYSANGSEGCGFALAISPVVAGVVSLFFRKRTLPHFLSVPPGLCPVRVIGTDDTVR
ncbi:MAG: hypothetical protein ACI84D_001102 [Thalassolituus oleivorans]|jgi:hypothetical protein